MVPKMTKTATTKDQSSSKDAKEGKDLPGVQDIGVISCQTRSGGPKKKGEECKLQDVGVAGGTRLRAANIAATEGAMRQPSVVEAFGVEISQL